MLIAQFKYFKFLLGEKQYLARKKTKTKVKKGFLKSFNDKSPTLVIVFSCEGFELVFLYFFHSHF